MSFNAESGRRRVSARELAIGLRVLADLLESGLSVNRALAALERVCRGHLRDALPHIVDAVRQGRSLAIAFDECPLAFPSIVIGVIQAGESAGGLSAAVRRAADIMEENAALRSAITTALAYPSLLFATGAASTCVLAFVVLPRFASILGDMGQALPRSATLLLGTASVARGALPTGCCLALAAAAVFHAWTSAEHGRRQWHALLLRAPLFGAARLAIATGRSCAALSALLENGLPIGTALPLAGRATGDAELSARFIAARQLLRQGMSLGHSLEETAAVTETAVRLARAGEESGRLAQMLHHASRMERDRAMRLTQAFVRALEPALIVMFGGGVALIAGALLQAIYSVRPTV